MDLSKIVHRFTVVPSLPKELEGLQRIAYNLSWSWEPEAIKLFQRIDAELWKETRHNPVAMLGQLQQATLDLLITDEGFMSHLAMVDEKIQEYFSTRTWYEKNGGNQDMRIAYFSMEFGIHESIPVYSGGLGVLSGDHLKSASDLGLPLVGIGLLYREGYFRQYLNIEGWQQEIYPENDFYNLPLVLERDEEGRPLRFEVEITGRRVLGQIWRVQVGRVPLYMLDTNLDENAPEDREITTRLYGGDQDMRIRQEIILGIGGIRALRLLGIKPNVCHMNEGHAAFLALERIRLLMEERRLSFGEAREVVRAGNIFTTHTPVEAGIDHFPPTCWTSTWLATTGPWGSPATSSWGSDGTTRAPTTNRSAWRSWPSSWPATPTASASSTARSPARCGGASGPNCRRSRSRSPPSPTASTPRAGSPMRWPGS